MSLDEAGVAVLRATLGAGALREGAPVEVDGRRLTWSLRPADGAALGEALRALSESGLAALVRGGGTRSGLGNPPRRADVVLSTAALAGVRELDVEEGVLCAGAGTPIPAIREILAGTGWELPLEAAGPGSTVGGALSTAAPGPRFPAPRDAVLGLDVVLASGARTRCGGRVVKNVTGYDLAKLYVGALGSLGVIESAWLRLRPVPEVVEWRRASLTRGPTSTGVLEAARRPAVRGAIVCSGAGVEPELWMELAGDAAAVAADAAWLDANLAARPAEDSGFDAAFAPALADERGLVGRVAFRPSRLTAATAPLAATGAHLCVLPAHGLCWARFAPASRAGDAAVEAALAALRDAARKGGGSWRVEAAPACAKRGRDVFGDPGEALPLMRALKQRFDPAGVLNAGRFAGGL